MLIYDGDEAGQRATKRAIPILEKAGIRVKVLQMKDAKDPDEFLKKFGADKFKLLLEESSNRVEYQLNAIARKYDLRIDDQRIRFLQESAELICTLGSSVQREIYSSRVAQAAKITEESMKLEVSKAFKRRLAREKKQQEKIDLAPAQALQPKTRSVRYDNLKSAMAEEGILAQAFLDPTLMGETDLTGSAFSVPLLGKVYDQMLAMYKAGYEVSIASLADISQEEMSHITGITQRLQGPVNREAFRDCVQTVRSASQASRVTSNEDLLSFRNKLKERKGL